MVSTVHALATLERATIITNPQQIEIAEFELIRTNK